MGFPVIQVGGREWPVLNLVPGPPTVLKGMPELSILPSLPPLDPFAGVTGR